MRGFVPFLIYAVIFLLCPPCNANDWLRLGVGAEEVLIFRDEFGVPHLKATSAPALFEVFGYVVAQDRLAQLELSRREARGRLAEIFGPDMLPTDIAARREFYTEEELNRQFGSLRKEAKELVEAYARGINRWMDECAGGGPLPWEFKQWGIEPEPWKATDSLAVMIAAGRRFGESGGRELENLEELRKLGKEEFYRRYPINDPLAPTTIAFLPQKNTVKVVKSFSSDRTEAQVSGWVGLPKRLGSYAILVAPMRSASGMAMLLGCPQMGLDGPQPGYEVDLHGGGFDVAGMTFPGVPIVLIGRNMDIAWTVTSGLSDNVDVFVEELTPNDSSRYLFQGERMELESRKEVFFIKGKGPHKETFYRSVHGPVFLLKEGKAFSHAKTFWGEELSALWAFLSINKAKNLEEFARCVETIPLSYNLFCATVTGEIGYWHAGKYRILPPGADPRLPLSGTGLEEWRGFIPKDWLPHKINPPCGFIANWNNKPSRDWPNGDNVPWMGRHRVERLFSAVGEGKLSFEDLAAIPQRIESHGTYQQVVELGGSTAGCQAGQAINILPPGESGAIGKGGIPHPHSNDQKALFEAWQYKPFYFFSGDSFLKMQGLKKGSAN